MAKPHRVTLNGESFTARSGQVLLDAAQVAGVDIPHDCRAGRCGTCITKVERGITLGGETHQRGMIYACQARVFSDLGLAVEPLPAVCTTDAQIARLVEVTADVVELTIVPSKPVSILPGQYCRFTFRGFPARAFSPTAAHDGSFRHDRFHLNIKRVRDGQVSTSLGSKIKVGHRLTIDGPYGHAFLRPNQSKRLVLVGSGTGFAPMWAVGHAALRENPERELVIVAGVRALASFYMSPALEFASTFPNVSIVATAEEAQTAFPHVLQGSPSDHVPDLDAEDVVYAAGAPRLVEAVGKRAQDADAIFYADPFGPAAAPGSEDWITRAVAWMRTERRTVEQSQRAP